MKSISKFAAFMLTAGFTFGQVHEPGASLNPPKGVVPTGYYDGSHEVVTINSVTGSVQTKIPIAQMPPGRAGTPGFELALYHSSASYRAARFDDYQGYDIMSLNGTVGGGWQYSSMYALEYEERIVPFDCSSIQSVQRHRYRHSLTLVLPDGSRHLLRMAGQDEYFGDGHYQYNPKGIPTFVPPNCLVTPPTPLAGNVRYYTTDGTFLSVEVINDADLGIGQLSWKLRFPDGRLMEQFGFAPGTHKMRRGNEVQYELQNFTVFNNSEIAFPIDIDSTTGWTGRYLDTKGRQLTMVHSYGQDFIGTQGVHGNVLLWTVEGSPFYGQPRATVCTTSPDPIVCDGQGGRPYQVFWPLNWGVTKVTYPYLLCGSEACQTLPAYTLFYNASTGGLVDVSRIETPSGVSFDLKYRLDQSHSLFLWWYDYLYDDVTEVVRSHTTEYGTVETERTKYNVQALAGWTEITSPEGGVTKVRYPWYDRNPATAGSPNRGLVDRIEHPDGSFETRLWSPNRPSSFLPAISAPNFYNPFVSSSTNTSAGKVSTRSTMVDKNGNTISDEVTDFDGKKTTTTSTYLLPTDAATVTPIGPDAPNVYASSTTERWLTASTGSETTTGWTDGRVESGYMTDRTAKTIIVYDSPNTLIGPKTIRRWDSKLSTSDLNAVYHETEFTYHPWWGNLLTVQEAGRTDGSRSVTKYTYRTEFVNGLQLSDLFVDKVERAFGTPQVKQTLFHSYDVYTGLVTSMTDETGKRVDTGYDSLGRPTTVDEYVSVSDKRRTSFSYWFPSRRVVEKRDKDTFDDKKLVQVRHFDRLGRLSLHRVLEDATGDVTNKDVGIKTEYRYHMESCTSTPCAATTGQYQLASNPYRVSSEATAGWTRTRRDSMGRVVQMRSFQGGSVPGWTDEGTPATTSGAVTTVYNQTHPGYAWVFDEVTDQQGKKRKTGYDAAGRVRAVIEDPNGVAYATTYDYTANGDLKRVTQGSQTRSFGMSSLGRLQTATNPETGMVTYTYDPNGNLVSRVAPKTVIPAISVTTTNTYDALNRVQKRTYSDATQAVTFCYDGKAGATTVAGECDGILLGAYQAGKLTEVRNSDSRSQYRSFDGLGRVVSSAQVTSGQAYVFSYQYSLSGLKKMVYPSGRTVVYEMDDVGRTKAASVERIVGMTAETSKLASLQYASHGAVSGRVLGNGVCDYLTFNARLQVEGGGVFRKQNAEDGPCNDGANGYQSEFRWTYNTAANNGNVMSHTVRYKPQLDGWFTQTYGFDGLNRLTTVTEALDSQPGIVLRQQKFVYDRYGNRALLLPNGTQPVLGDETAKAVVSMDNAAAVEALFPGNQWAGAEHDAAGRMVRIGTVGQSGHRGLTYDAEGRITGTVVTQGSTTMTGTNVYDGEGRRIRKTAGVQGAGMADTVYVYDGFGQLAAEYANVNPVELGTTYYSRDSLGSTRVVSGAGGTVRRRIDYWPFGEEVSGLDRGSYPGYGGNVYPGARGMVDEKFTGKERDAETGLDYFGARYMSAVQGRFTSPDPLFFQAEMVTDPQRFNPYAYGRNNPLKFVDPTGKEIELIGDEEQRKKTLALLRQGADAAGSQLQVKEKKGFFGLGKTHYMVKIEGDAKKFAAANPVAGDLAKIIQHSDTVQVGIAGGNETLNAVSGKTTLNQEQFNGMTGFFGGIVGSLGSDLRSYVKDPAEGSYSRIPGYKMDNGRSAEANPMFTLFHELGHAWAVMQGQSNPQIIQGALDLENKVRKLQDPKSGSRVVH